MPYLWIATAVVLAFTAYILLAIRRLQSPTKGPAIDLATRPGTALVLIDLQPDFTTMFPDDDRDAAFARVRAMAHSAKKKGWPVIAVRQVFDNPLARGLNRLFNKGRGNAGSPGIGLDPRLGVTPDADFAKPAGDAFSAPAFVARLERDGIGTLCLVGLDGAWCVKNTAHGALNRGYRVRIDTNAILAADEPAWNRERQSLVARGPSFTLV